MEKLIFDVKQIDLAKLLRIPDKRIKEIQQLMAFNNDCRAISFQNSLEHSCFHSQALQHVLNILNDEYERLYAMAMFTHASIIDNHNIPPNPLCQ